MHKNAVFCFLINTNTINDASISLEPDLLYNFNYTIRVQNIINIQAVIEHNYDVIFQEGVRKQL